MSALAQQTEEWFKMRKEKIGASDAPVIMEVSPWKTPYELWLEKTGVTSSYIKTPRMERGLQLEDECRFNFFLETGIPVKPEVITSNNINWMMASLDGISDDRKTIVEIKCPGEYDHLSARKGVIPAKYVQQLQHQMVVCELDESYYYSYDGKEGVLLKAHRDEPFIKEMLEREEHFWECMQTFKPPKLCDRDVHVRKDDIWVATAQQFLENEVKLALHEEERERLKRELIELSGNRNCNGGGIQLNRIVRKGNINYASIPELQGKDLESYRSPNTEMWRITTK